MPSPSLVLLLVAMGSQHLDMDMEEVTDEVFARRAMARQRQITIGKSRPEYKLYSTSIPYHRRTEHMPQTPDPYARISKRAFDRELACWRRGLHVCSSQLEVSNGSVPKAFPASGGDRGESHKWADFSPGKDWSPNGTESTRAESEASSPFKHSNCATPGTAEAAGASKAWNVKLNLFEHLSAPPPPQSMPTGGNLPAMPQMLPQMPGAAAWELYPTAPTTSPMMGVLGGPGQSPQASMLQLGSVEQQQCTYAMPYGWGAETMAPWMPAQQSTPQVQPLIAHQMPPTDSTSSSPEAAAELMWQPAVAQRLPGTPRSSKNHTEDTPSTPLNKVVRTAQSPGMPSPWTGGRTPSPDYSQKAQFRASQLPNAPTTADVDHWAGACLMVITQTYLAESDGYLSVNTGSQVRAMMDTPHRGDSKCAWPTYVFCSQGAASGWVPQQILWRCYVDDNGRRWACDDSTGTWCWVDEIEKNQSLQCQ